MKSFIPFIKITTVKGRRITGFPCEIDISFIDF